MIPKDLSFFIVDDLLSMRQSMMSSLRNLEFTGEIIEAGDGQEAVEVLERLAKHGKLPDIILSDNDMPRMSGIDFLKYLKKDNELKKILFILVTTINEKPKVLEALAVGVDNYVIKPWTDELLLKCFNQVWDKNG